MLSGTFKLFYMLQDNNNFITLTPSAYVDNWGFKFKKVTRLKLSWNFIYFLNDNNDYLNKFHL